MKKDVCVLWIDAHCDINTKDTSDSGNIHGMPLALLVKELTNYWPRLPGMEWMKPTLTLKNIAYIGIDDCFTYEQLYVIIHFVGLRSVDPYERLICDKFDVAAFGMDQVDQLGISNVIAIALNKIDPKRDKSIHVSFDIDALDEREAPSTGTASKYLDFIYSKKL